jgi:1-acyl-sn-glycerol-3-phosphate acyltransferase
LIAGILATVARFISGATALWVDCQPSPRQRIYYANHTSHLDFVVLWSVLPRDARELTRPVAALEYWTADRVRRYLAEQVFKAVLVDRHAPDLASRQNQIEKMLAGLGKSHSLIIFPEGTRGTGEEVAPFKSGLYHLARQRPDIELVPVYLENLNRIMPKGEFLPVPLLSRVFFGPPLRFQPGEAKEDFLRRTRDALVSLGRFS